MRDVFEVVAEMMGRANRASLSNLSVPPVK
jgi:hypothetical protein